MGYTSGVDTTFALLTLTKRNGEHFQNPMVTEIQKALHDLFVARKTENALTNFVSLINVDELEMQIYKQTIVLQDWGRHHYDGPGGPGELLRVRYKEGSLLPKIEEAAGLLNEEERGGLIKLLNALPKPG